MIKRVLVGVVGGPALEAKARCAIDLAQRHGAEVTLLSIVDVERIARVGAVPLGAGKYASNLRKKRIEASRRRAEDAISWFEGRCNEVGVPVHVARQEGDAIKALAFAWRFQDICLLGARGWFDSEVMPDPQGVLLQVVAAGARPLICVTDDMGPVRRALFGYSGSVESARTIKAFMRMGLWPDVEVHVVCVTPLKSGDEPQSLLEEALAYGRAHGYSTTVAQCEGVPWEALLSQARAIEADVIGVGSSCRRVLRTQRFGKNVRNLLEFSDRPLFLSN